MNEWFFFLQSVFGRYICSVFMVVTMPSSLVRVNKARGWQIVAAVLSNIHYRVKNKWVCVRVQGVMLWSHMFHFNMHEMYFQILFIILWLCLFRQWTMASSWKDNQYICLASLHNPLVFDVNSNSAVLEHKNVGYGWTTSNPFPIKWYRYDILFINIVSL